MGGSLFVLLNKSQMTDHFNRLTHLTNEKSGEKVASYYDSCSYYCSFSCFCFLQLLLLLLLHLIRPPLPCFFYNLLCNVLMTEIWPIKLCDMTHYNGHFCNPMQLNINVVDLENLQLLLKKIWTNWFQKLTKLVGFIPASQNRDKYQVG